MTPTASGVPTAADFAGLSSATLGGLIGGVLPVELTSFSAHLKSNVVELRWNTATEKNNYGFEIERSIDGKNWSMVASVEGFGNSNSPKSYSHNDAVDGLNGTVSYRLKQVDRDGTTDYSSTVMVKIADAAIVSITDAYPNPFNPTTIVNFTLIETANVRLALYDITGREVKTIIDNAPLSAGTHSQTINADGLPSGRYMVVLQTPAARSVYSVLLSK
ncbi:MAG: T9SS type A sorting domain-containing protein [Bacteroidota bacterium]